MAMARASSGLAYPDRFFAAAAYAGFGGSPNSSSKGVTSKFSNDVALLLYALYQQNSRREQASGDLEFLTVKINQLKKQIQAERVLSLQS